MTKQELARTRNWQKARLSGISFDMRVFTETERTLLEEFLGIKTILLQGWDRSTENLIGHSLPPYKCNWCGKRGTKQYIVEGENFCFKHHKEVQK